MNADVMKLVLESTGDQIFAADLSGKYTIFNDAHKRLMVECYGQEIQLDMDPETMACHRFDTGEFRGACIKAYSGEPNSVFFEFGDPSIRRFWTHATFNPMFEGGQLIGITVFIRDASESKATETELMAEKEAAQADAKAKSAFLSSMSHEIRTPMNAILGLTEILLQKKHDETSVENLKAIKFSANNLLSIINDILDFSKIEAGKFGFEIQPFDLFHVLEEINKGIQVSAKARNLVYDFQISPSIPRFFRGDSVRLSQILLNLLGNSLKFTKAGRILLAVDVIGESDAEIEIEFKVSDTGIGIPKSQLSNIFNSFTQVHRNNRFNSQGTGLGLSITKRLVELQQGSIEVESEVGKGTVFTFRLRYFKANQRDLEPESEGEEIRSNHFQNLKVLVVEDNKINQLLAKQLLTSWGVTVEVANDGFEAIAKLQRRTFDLILLDLQMPEIDGFEVTRFVRKTIKAPANQIPIVALTADAFTETKQLTQNAGMNDFITKPFQQKDLLRVLRKFSPQDYEIRESDVAVEIAENQSIDFEFIKDKFGKDPETFRYILEVFINDIAKELELVRGYIEKNDNANASKLAHKLVSTFSAMGMPDTAFNTSLIERMLKGNDDPIMIREKWVQVEKEYNQASTQAKPVLESLNA
jgi:signal transduction histidine kinase/CheY-like chemotaxis protein/HPt (histidine-containing phosphotransfer) domain-containing protein